MAECDMHYNGDMVPYWMRNGGLVPPIAPEGGSPVYPGGNENIPETPDLPEGGFPVFPGPSFPSTPTLPSIPVIPSTPMVPSIPTVPSTPTVPSIPTVPSTPTVPSRPTIPSIPTVPAIPYPPQQYYGQVRFLNASSNVSTVTISIDGVNYAINSRFGTISNYDWIADGFHTVTVRSAGGQRAILYQNTFPFVANEKVTMVLIDSGSGLDMIKVNGKGCNNLPFNSGCYRMSNMSYSGTRYNLMLYGGNTIFRNIGFGETSSYKQAVAGSYQFYLTNSNNFSVIREIPVIVIGSYPSAGMVSEPVLTYEATIAAGRTYTTYIIGNNWSNNSLRALTVED